MRSEAACQTNGGRGRRARRRDPSTPIELLRGLWGVGRSELTKLRTVRSTFLGLLATVILVVGVGALETGERATHWPAHISGPAGAGFDPTVTSLVGLLVGQVSIGVVGVLVMNAEYATGAIRTTFAAVPRRTRVLAAKVAVFGAVALGVGEVASFAAFLAGQSLLAGHAPHATLGQPGVLRAVVSGGLYLAVLGLFALGMGAIIRHTAGAIAAVVSLLFVLPGIVASLPVSLENVLDRYLPVNIWAVLVAVRPGRLVNFATPGTGVPTAILFGPWAGLAVLAGYAAVAVVVGGWLIVRRDA